MNKPWWQNLEGLIAAIIGFILIQCYTHHGGIGVSPDSIHYLSTANNLLEGKGYYQFDLQPLIMFPFGYPSFLACIKLLFSIDLLNAMPIINGLLFGALIFLSGWMMQMSGTQRELRWLLLALIATSPSLNEIFSMLWSESLFALEVLLFVLFAGKYFKTYQLKYLISWSVLTAISFETRFAGVSLVATGGLLILISHDINWNKKIKHALLFGTISCLLVVINLGRNYVLTNTLTGIRQKGVTGFMENTQHFGSVIASWLPFGAYLASFSLWVGLIFLVLIFSIFIYRFIYKIEHNSFEKIAATFTLLYAAFMLVTATLSRYETINSRLLSPFYIATLFTISFYATSWVAFIKNKTNKYLVGGIFVLIGLYTLVGYGKHAYDNYEEVRQGGIGGYTEDDWRESELIAHIDKTPAYFKLGVPLYSNASHAIYLFTHQAINIVPERVHQQKVAAFSSTPQLILFWFNNEENKDVLYKSEIEKLMNCKQIGVFKDGIILICTRK